ncbi:MAG: GntR family transcriptional regulator [Alphaproteobacteria bacterium]|nr:GntR family transcriptional regulator [Alphaproteobacteria bacterium]
MTIAAFLAPDQWQSARNGPLYEQLFQRLTQAVAQGLLPPGSTLPPEREIAQLTALSRVTVRRAVQMLVRDGLIVQKQGSGSFVADVPARLEQSMSRLTSFTEDMARRGLTTTTRWLGRGIHDPSPDEVIALGLRQEDRVARLARLRLADTRPLAIERAALPLVLLPDPGRVTTSLYAVLAEGGHPPVRALQKISAVNLGPDDAALLQVSAGEAGLRIERISYLDDGSVAEFTRSVYRGDAYNFVAELRLTRD